VFPGHLPHRVEPSRFNLTSSRGGEEEEEEEARVSISFNLLGDWGPPLTTTGHYRWQPAVRLCLLS
jgi:hypothetical protein